MIVTVAGVVILWCGSCASSIVETGTYPSVFAMRARRYPRWPVFSKSEPEHAARNFGPGLLSRPKSCEGSLVSWKKAGSLQHSGCKRTGKRSLISCEGDC